jgi:hypothetical protein
VRVVGDDRVEVPDHEHAGPAAPAQAADQVRGVAGRGALHALDLRLGRHEGDGQRGALLRTIHVAGRRRHGHERLELALGGESHAGRCVDHRSGAAKW